MASEGGTNSFSPDDTVRGEKNYCAPGVDESKIKEFFLQKKTSPCPSCGHHEVSILANSGEDMVQNLVVYKAKESDAGYILQGPTPIEATSVISIMCTNCFYISLYSANGIEKWLKTQSQ
jgi:predicted nucleic-acid-binding Zn-ribbon protein